MNDKSDIRIPCRCGKKAIGLIAGEGWLCKECYDKKIKEHEAKTAAPKTLTIR